MHNIIVYKNTKLNSDKFLCGIFNILKCFTKNKCRYINIFYYYFLIEIHIKNIIINIKYIIITIMKNC